jgi:DnaJ-class molecular chaperone
MSMNETNGRFTVNPPTEHTNGPTPCEECGGEGGHEELHGGARRDTHARWVTCSACNGSGDENHPGPDDDGERDHDRLPDFDTTGPQDPRE